MLEQLADLASGVAGGNVDLTLSAPLAGYAFRVAKAKGLGLKMKKVGGVFHINSGELVDFVNASYGYSRVAIPDPEVTEPDVEEVDVSAFEDDGGLLSAQDEEIITRDGPVEVQAALPAGARASEPGPGGVRNLPNTAKSPKDRSTNDAGGGNNMRDATDGLGSGNEKVVDPNDPDAEMPHKPRLPSHKK